MQEKSLSIYGYNCIGIPDSFFLQLDNISERIYDMTHIYRTIAEEMIMGTIKKLFALDEGIAKELDIVAAAVNKTQREVVETALDFYFDYTDGIVADKITEEIKNGKMKVYDSDEVYDKLGIDL